MRALIRKSLGRGHAVIAALGTAFALSLWDLASPWYEHGLPLLAAAVVLGSLVAGVACLSLDLGDRSIDLLEHLPVRRSSIWTADILTATAVCLASVLLLCSWRTALFGPYVWQEDSGWVSLLLARFDLLLGLSGVALAGLGTGVLARASVRRDVEGFVLAFVVALLALAGGSSYLSNRRLVPSPTDLAPLLLILGAGCLLGGFLVLAGVPPHVATARHGNGRTTRAAMFVAILAVGSSVFAAWAAGWEALEASEKLDVQTIQTTVAGPGRWLFAKVSSRRSGHHLLAVDLVTGAVRDAGRGLTPLPPERQPRTGEISVWNDEGAIFLWTPSATGLRRVLPGSFSRSDLLWTADGRFVVFREAERDGPRRWIVAADALGHEVHRVEISDRRSRYARGPGGLLLVSPVEVDPSGGTETDLLLDLVSGNERRIQRPTSAPGATPDLTRYVEERRRVDGAVVRSSLVLVDLATGEKRVVLPEADLPAGTLKRGPEVGWATVSPDPEHGLFGVWAPAGCFDPASRHAAFLLARRTGDLRTFSLLAVDLETGARQEVAGEDSFPRLPLLFAPADDSLPVLYGFTEDGGGILYGHGGSVYVVEIQGGEPHLLASRQGRGVVPFVCLSPSRRHAAIVQRFRSSCVWADEERLVRAARGRIVLVPDAGHGRPVRLYPAGPG